MNHNLNGKSSLREKSLEWAKAQGYQCQELGDLGFVMSLAGGLDIMVFQGGDDEEFFSMFININLDENGVERTLLLEAVNKLNETVPTMKFIITSEGKLKLSLEYIMPAHAAVEEVMGRYVRMFCQAVDLVRKHLTAQ